MSSTPNRAGNPAGKPRRKEITLDLRTTRQMLPLVKSIVADITASRSALARLVPEQDRLERHRRDLVWQERERRYQIKEEMTACERAITAAVAELGALGVRLLDDQTGAIDFPTKINGRTAAFTWKPEETAVAHWHYTDEDQRRPIPADWDAPAATATRSRGQS